MVNTVRAFIEVVFDNGSAVLYETVDLAEQYNLLAVTVNRRRLVPPPPVVGPYGLPANLSRGVKEIRNI